MDIMTRFAMERHALGKVYPFCGPEIAPEALSGPEGNSFSPPVVSGRHG